MHILNTVGWDLFHGAGRRGASLMTLDHGGGGANDESSTGEGLQGFPIVLFLPRDGATLMLFARNAIVPSIEPQRTSRPGLAEEKERPTSRGLCLLKLDVISTVAGRCVFCSVILSARLDRLSFRVSSPCCLLSDMCR